jgi:hypothetical protein
MTALFFLQLSLSFCAVSKMLAVVRTLMENDAFLFILCYSLIVVPIIGIMKIHDKEIYLDHGKEV